MTIGGSRYMDGGVGSTVNMELAADCDVVGRAGAAGPRRRRRRSAPARPKRSRRFRGAAFGVFADDESLAAFGANPLDPACRTPSALAGREQGRRVAGEVADFLATLNQTCAETVSGFSQICPARSAASSRPTSMTSAARWNSRLRHAVRGTSINTSGG